MEQSCNVFRHGRLLFECRSRNPSSISSFTFPSGAHLGLRERDQVAFPLIILLGQFTYMFCNPGETRGTCDQRVCLFQREKVGVR